jgi:HEAT repeat protein
MAILVVAWCAWRSLGESRGVVQSLAFKAASGDPKAVAELRALGSNAVPGLIELLRYKEPFLHRQADALAPKLPRRLGRELMSRVGRQSSSDMRATGAKSLALLGAQAEVAVPDLLRLLHDREQYVAILAGAALARIGKPALPGLIAALSETNAVVRHAAAYGLGEMGPAAESAVPGLIAALEDQDPTVRSSTAYSLSRIGHPTLLALSNVIDHADASAREVAVKEFIWFHRSLKGMSPALNKMAHAPDAGSRRLAVEALGAAHVADDSTLGTFVALLEDPVDEVRVAALKALYQVAWRAAPAINALQKCLRDPSPAVRTWAARVLGAIGPASRMSLADLTVASRDEDANVRLAAEQALSKINSGDQSGN